MNGEDLRTLNSLLNHFTSNSVQLPRVRKTEALNSWEPIVDEILVRVKAETECFASLQIIHSGSYYERTKVREPDEFDLMLVMNNVEFVELSGFCNKPPTGFTSGVIRTNNRYSATEIKADFARLVKESIKVLGYERNVTVRSHGPTVTLKITNKNGREYSVDMTLAIKHESWPEDAEEWKRRHRNGWPNKKLVQEIYQDGCHLVAKHPKGDNVSEQEKKILWRYSFSTAEKKLFLQSGHDETSSCWKQVLRILKAVKEELNLKPLNSYHLKTILLYECEENPLPSQWSSTHLGERFMGLLQKLENCLMQSSCPHYFIPHFNLFKTFSCRSCHDLAKKVREIRLQPGEVFNILMLQSLQQSVQQALEQSLMQAMEQALNQAAKQQDQMHLLEQAMEQVVEQVVEEAVEQALRQSQGEVQEQFLEQALGALLQALSAQAEAVEESLENTLVQELEQELGQVRDQSLLKGQEQAWEQAYGQALEQAMGKALQGGIGHVPGKAQGRALGQSLGQALGESLVHSLVLALQRTLEQSLEQLASFLYLLTYYFTLSLCAVIK